MEIALNANKLGLSQILHLFQLFFFYSFELYSKPTFSTKIIMNGELGLKQLIRMCTLTNTHTLSLSHTQSFLRCYFYFLPALLRNKRFNMLRCLYKMVFHSGIFPFVVCKSSANKPKLNLFFFHEK